MKRYMLLLFIVITLIFSQGCTQKIETEHTPPPTQSVAPVPTPSPAVAVPKDPNETVLAAVEALFLTTNEEVPYLQYWAESGSGPSPWYGIDKDIYLPRLKNLFSAHDWEHVQKQPEEPYIEPPEGAAHSLVFRGSGVISMQYGKSYITVRDEFYQTEDCPTLYRALEELWYEAMGPRIKNVMLKVLDEFGTDKAVTVRMNEGATKREPVDWDKIGPQIRELFEAQTWISIPGGPVDYTVQKGQAVILSNGESKMEFWAAGPYLSYQGYSYKTVDMDGNDSPLYDTLCNLLGLAEKAVAVTPSPAVKPTDPQGGGSKETPVWIDTIIKGTDDLRLEYFADGASGPSLTHSSWGNSDVDGLRAILTAYAWEKTEEPLDNQEWTDEMNPPEGGAYRIRLLGKSGFCEMDYGYSKRLCFRGADGSTDYYTTTDYDGFYEAMERFSYQLEWQNIRTYLWSNLNEYFSGKTLTLSQNDGVKHEIAWADISGEAKKLIESRIWVFLPEGSQKLDSEGERLTLSTGEEDINLIAYAKDGYLQTPGYLYKAVKQDGNAATIYADLCVMLNAT